ncbi:hypothetical protein NDA07_16665 [Microcoleus vaginatus DQ-U2]|uniref:hypothetical protein n=1 Tax=Microcoleus vaginatus TaxID=119532 RepID=UPI001683585E|nr:hypothetical protein [Microcoleus sp. FACHB-DQ6]
MPATLYYYFDRDSNLFGKRAMASGPASYGFFLHEEASAGRLFHKGTEKEEFTSAGRIARYA